MLDAVRMAIAFSCSFLRTDTYSRSKKKNVAIFEKKFSIVKFLSFLSSKNITLKFF
jgi:hypothetical protein